MDKHSVAFDLDYLAYQYDEEGRELWRMQWRTERVYLVRLAPSLTDPLEDFQVRRLSDDSPLGAGNTKLEACDCAYLRLMDSTRRADAPLAYSRIGE